MICARCSRDIYKYETCNYCNRKICFDCVKSSKRISKTVRQVICKDCWSIMKSRKAYKSAMLVQPRVEEERPYRSYGNYRR